MTLEEQVGRLTGRVYQLEKEVERLKALTADKAEVPDAATSAEVRAQENLTQTESVSPISQSTEKPCETPVQQPVNAGNVPPVQYVANGQAPAGYRGNQVPPITAAQANMRQQQQNFRRSPAGRDSGSMEKAVGTKVMAIVASVLVFVSLILFGSLVFEYIPAIGKVGIMAAVSAIFAAVGLLRMKKESKYKVLFSAIAGSGVGGLYITILVAAFLIESIHLPVLLIMLGAWTLFVIILSKFMSRMFAYICYIGAAVTTVYFGFFGNESIIALIYFVASVVLLFVVNYTGSFFADAFFYIQLPVAAFGLSMFYENTGWVHPALAGLMAAVLCGHIFVYKYTKKDAAPMIVYSILSLISMALLISRFGELFAADFDYLYEIFAGVLILIAVIFGIRFYGKQRILYYPAFYGVAALLAVMEYSSFTEKYIGLAPLMLGLIIAGHIADNKHFKYVGFAYYILYAIKMDNVSGIQTLIVLGIMAITLACVFVMTKIRYTMADKLAVFAGALIMVCEIAARDYINHTTVFILLAAISIVVNKKWFSQSPVDGGFELPSAIVSYIMNGIMMIWGSFMLMDCRHNLMIVKEIENSSLLMIMLVSLLTIGMFSMNTAELFKLGLPEALVGVYICLKFTWLVNAIMIRLDAAGYIVSLAGLALAIAFIVVGFMLHKRSFRLYGLILTMLCVFKLVIMDIEYNYDLLKPVSYLVAGVLCFGISWFYSRIEKKESREEQQTNRE